MAKVEDLDKIVIQELEEYVGLCVEDLKESQKAAAKAAVKKLKATAPRKSGKYAKSWRSKTTAKRGHSETRIFAGRYYLTHLLEHGHRVTTKDGKVVGQAEPHPHIKDAETLAISTYQEELRRRIEG